MVACPHLPGEPVAVLPWTLSLHLPTVAARLAAVGPEVRSPEEEPGFRLGPGMEVWSVRLPSPMTPGLLEGLSFTRGDGAEVWTVVHRQLPGSWDASLRPPGCDRLVGVEWRLWVANGPCPPVVMWPRCSAPGPRWETIVVLWGWVTIRGAGGHAFTAPRGMAVDSDGRVALQLTAEPLTTHVVVVFLHWGAERLHSWRDPIARVPSRDFPALQATIWPEAAGRQPPGALPWLWERTDASPPPEELRGALERPYRASTGGHEHGPRHSFLVATDH